MKSNQLSCLPPLHPLHYSPGVFKHNYPELIARDSGLDTMDLSTAMANRGVWEEISMTVLSTPVVKG